MKKKRILLAGIALVVLSVFACDMPLPTSVKFKTDKLEINAPIKIGRFNLATILTEVLKDSFPEGFEFYDMVDYPNALAFLIGYQMDIMESFNPDDYLKDLGDTDPIDPDPITIPKLTTSAVLENWHFFPMSNFFDNFMYPSINDVPKTVPNVTSQASFNFFKPPAPFDAVFVHEGEIEISLDFGGAAAPPGLEVTLHNVTITGPTYFGTQVSKTMTLGPVNYSDTIDISNSRIGVSDTLQVSIGSINSTSSDPVDLKIEIKNIELRGAERLRSGSATDSLPPQIVQDFGMAPIDDMINARITEGKFDITADPPRKNGTPGKTYSEDLSLNIGYTIYLKQDPVSGPDYPPDDPPGSLSGLNNVMLTKANSSLNSVPGDEKWINGNALTVDEIYSMISISADTTDGITFELFHDDHDGHDPLGERKLPIKVSMSMNIDELEIVRWKTISSTTGQSIFPPIDIPEVNFSNMGSQNVSFIKSISFSEINLNFTTDLSTQLINHIALKVSCPELGFNPDPPKPDNPKTLVDGDNIIISEPSILDVSDSNPRVIINAQLIPVINGAPKEDSAYVEFGPVRMVDENNNPIDEIEMKFSADINIEYTWTEALIDLKHALQITDSSDALTGTYPDPKDGNMVDLSDLHKYMSGITFSGAAAKIFFSGRDNVVERIQPEMEMVALWEGDDSILHTMKILDRQIMTVSDLLPELPGKNDLGEMVYYGVELPEPDRGLMLEDTFSELIAEFPRDLRFTYEMVLGNDDEVTIYPDMFENAEGDSKIKALLVLQLSMEFSAAPGGYFSLPGDLFGEGSDGKDLFGRKEIGDESAFTGIDVKKLGMKIDFGYPLFNGSYLHFDKDDILFGENGLRMGSGNILNVTFTSAQQKRIDNNLVYPNVRFVFPDERKMRISRDFLPARIVIAASGSYTMDLEDLFELGN